MLERPGILQRLLSMLTFSHVEVHPEEVDRLKLANEQGRVVYVTRSHSLLDYLFFNWLLRDRGLALCRYAVGISTILFRPLTRMLGRARRFIAGERFPKGPEALDQAVRGGGPAFLFLGKPRTLTRRVTEFSRDHFEQLLRIQREDETPILLVPLLILWRPSPVTLKPTFLDAMLGGIESPGRLRKTWQVLLSPRRAQVQVGDPIDLSELLAERAEETDHGLARKVRGAIHIHLARRARVAMGPKIKSRERMQREIARQLRGSPAIRRVAEKTGKSPELLIDEARKLTREIAADFKWGVLRALYWLMRPVWHRLYDGIEVDEAGFRKVAEAAQESPVVLVPSHKSHIDYLILSWVFMDRALVPPHIAAGANLSFFPLGLLFRRAGAFFLRRSFRGDPLYPVVFRAYMQKLLREGYNLEFFLEGGRSRTGKVLQPKLGLLSYVVDAVLDPGGTRDVRFIPVAVGYERIVEAGSYERELGGGEKQAEDVKGLIGARKLLRRRYGRLYLEFAESISLREWMQDRGEDPDNSPREGRKPMVRVLGHDLAYRISKVTTVTPVSLVATALLTQPRRGTHRRDLLAKVGFLQALAADRGARFSASIRLHLDAAQARLMAGGDLPLEEAPAALAPAALPESCPASSARGEALAAVIDEAVELFLRDRAVTRHDYGADEVIYTVSPDHRIRLDFYRNGLVPLIVPEVIVATAALAAARGEDPIDGARRLSRILKFEFLYRVDSPFEELYEEAADALGSMRLIEREKGRVVALDSAAPALGYLREMLRPYLEGYLASARCMLAPGGPSGASRSAVAQFLKTAERMYLQGDLSVREACSGVMLENARRSLSGFSAEELPGVAESLERFCGEPRDR